jgi:hypothetical protein
MKARLYTAAIAASLIAAFAQSSYAAPISISDTTLLPTGFVTAPNGGSSGNFVLSTIGSVPNQTASPFSDTTTAYSVLGAGPLVPGSSGNPFGTATFDYAAGISSWQLVWGSPDVHNTVEVKGTNGLDHTFNGINVPGVTLGNLGTGGYFVTVNAPTGDLITSVILTNFSQAAFEYDNVTPTPLPAALPLFASALGLGGFFAAWRKKKAAKSQVAVA